MANSCKKEKITVLLRVLTTNRLIDRRPVWYGADEERGGDIGEAAVADNPQARVSLEQAGHKKQ